MNTLIVGCGMRPKPGCVNLDKFKLPSVDVVFDLNWIGRSVSGLPDASFQDGRWITINGMIATPFDYDYFDRVEAEDVLEHVEDIVAVVQELGRVLEVGGTLWVRGPDCRYPEQCWADPTHRRLFAPRSFDNFDPETYDGRHYGHYFGSIKFKVEKVESVNKGLEFTLTKRG